MKKELTNYIHTAFTKEDSFSAEFCFPASFSGFDGHFPDQPVLPGVCLVEAVLVAAEQTLDQRLELTEIVLAKFFSVSQPNETLTAVCRVDEEMIRAKISRGDDRIAEVRLRIDYA